MEPRVEGDLERGGALREGLGPSSEAGTRPRGRQALVRGVASRGVLGPSSEAGTRPRGRQALERGGFSMLRRLPLERDGGSLEGRRGRLLVEPLRLFGPWVFLCLGPRPCGM
jgi:hypothetical protein